jgi:Rrf2 family protein
LEGAELAMLTLTRKTEYGLIAICHLAQVGRKVVSARDIAELHAVPLPLLMNVLKRLNRVGYISSVRGAHGGYALAADPERLTLADVIDAVEGPVHLVRCVNTSGQGRKCDRSSQCFIRNSVAKVHVGLRKFLGAVTIADLALRDPPSGDAAKVAVQ